MATTLKATERENFKHSSLRKLRDENKIPAVVYGNNKDSVSVYVNEKDFIQTIKENGRNGIIQLDIGGQKENVILSEYQQDCIKRNLLHADFLIVNMSEEIDVEVRIELTGTAKGVKEGGILQQSLHTVMISAKPDQIPEVIQYDISNLEIGDSVNVADLKSSSEFNIKQVDEDVITSILPPTLETQAEAEPEGDGETETKSEE